MLVSSVSGPYSGHTTPPLKPRAGGQASFKGTGRRLAVGPLGCPDSAIAHYGFMERPDIPRLLSQLEKRGCTIDLADVTYFVGHETVIRREDGKGLPGWQEALFAFMEPNAAHLTDFFNLPGDQVVEIGRQISI